MQPPQQPGTPGRARRRPDLTLPMPQREVATSLAVPLPLPPQPSSSSSAPASAGGPTPPGAQQQQPPPLAELERVRRVGSGAGGTVWLVRHRGTGRAYALKVLYGNHDDAVRRQIAREIAILRAADHPAVVRCHGMYERGGELQILLEYMDGGSLDGRRAVPRRRRPPGARRDRLPPPPPHRAPRHQALQPPHRRRAPRQDRRLRRRPDPQPDHGPLQLLRRHHRLHEPRADQHRPQRRQLRRLRRRHLELRAQHSRVLPRKVPLRGEPRQAGGLGRAHGRHLLLRSTRAAVHRIARVQGIHQLLPAEEPGQAPHGRAAAAAPLCRRPSAAAPRRSSPVIMTTITDWNCHGSQFGLGCRQHRLQSGIMSGCTVGWTEPRCEGNSSREALPSQFGCCVHIIIVLPPAAAAIKAPLDVLEAIFECSAHRHLPQPSSSIQLRRFFPLPVL